MQCTTKRQCAKCDVNMMKTFRKWRQFRMHNCAYLCRASFNSFATIVLVSCSSSSIHSFLYFIKYASSRWHFICCSINDVSNRRDSSYNSCKSIPTTQLNEKKEYWYIKTTMMMLMNECSVQYTQLSTTTSILSDASTRSQHIHTHIDRYCDYDRWTSRRRRGQG